MLQGSRPLRKNSLPFQVLAAIADGALRVTVAMVAIGATASYSKTTRRWGYQLLDEVLISGRLPRLDATLRHKEHKRRLAKAVAEVRRKRFVQLKKRANELVLEITEEGKRRLFRYELEKMSILPQKYWDGIWRVVLFDIPEKYREGRNVFRARLMHLGFFPLQKSAFVCPYPCRDEIDAVIQAYGLAPYVTFFETPELGYQEAKALAHFDLRKPRKK